MNLTEAQKAQVAQWINEGLKLADIQKKLVSEFSVTLTYMDVRLLVDDLRLTPKDPVPPPAPPKPPEPVAPPAEDPTLPAVKADAALPAPGSELLGLANVAVVVDRVARPGAMVSGSVTFSDGQKATWYLDQMGRLGVAPEQKGYKPAPADVEGFQRTLEVELSKMGL